MNTGVLCYRWMQTDICAGGAAARRSALFTRRQHGTHGAVRMRTIYSTALDYSAGRTAQCAFRGATARRGALLTGHSTARTAQCAHRGATARRNALQHPSHFRPQHGTHGAVRTPGSHSTVQCAAAPQRFIVHAQTRALQDISPPNSRWTTGRSRI